MIRRLLSVFLVLAPLATHATNSTDGVRLPGGDTTPARVPVDPRLAYSELSANLGRVGALDAKIGQALFDRLWVTAPASTQASDGLGPLYNARACGVCHFRNGRGLPNGGKGYSSGLVLHLSVEPVNSVAVLSAPDTPSFIPEPSYGKQLQTFATPGLDAEGKVSITYSESVITLSDGQVVTMHAPQYRISDLKYGPLDSSWRFSPRVGPPIIGLGLLEHISEADIAAWEDPQDVDVNGIRGIAQRVVSWPRGDRSDCHQSDCTTSAVRRKPPAPGTDVAYR